MSIAFKLTNSPHHWIANCAIILCGLLEPQGSIRLLPTRGRQAPTSHREDHRASRRFLDRRADWQRGIPVGEPGQAISVVQSLSKSAGSGSSEGSEIWCSHWSPRESPAAQAPGIRVRRLHHKLRGKSSVQFSKEVVG